MVLELSDIKIIANIATRKYDVIIGPCTFKSFDDYLEANKHRIKLFNIATIVKNGRKVDGHVQVHLARKIKAANDKKIKKNIIKKAARKRFARKSA